MATLTARIIDKATGQPIEARAQVLSSGGRFLHPMEAILKVGPGQPFFYCDGGFTVDAPVGITRVLVERGTEYVPAQVDCELPSRGTVALDIELERWARLGEAGWHPGNTHIHYDDHEARPDDRLRLDPRVEDLRVTAISVLERWNLPYASNKYPAGMLTEFCSAHHYVECGEENRHNLPGNFGTFGYGHVMLLRLQQRVEPVSRGFLIDDTDPDYPPLCYACDDAHRQGGIVIWCHNGQGMEAPVAAALGKLDAFNLFDPQWMDPEYRLWYAMLNCGFRLPASTGSDWFISSANRVYAQTGGAFSYPEWVAALQAGRTFITNGPGLMLTVADQAPGDTLHVRPGDRLPITVSWTSHYAVQSVEIIWNGEVAARRHFHDGSREGEWTLELEAPSDGWVAARLSSTVRDSFYQPIFAHTSPVYVQAGRIAEVRREAATLFDDAIERYLEWVDHQGRFRTPAQRHQVRDLFMEGQAVYRTLRG